MSNKYKHLILLFLAVCIMQAQTPANAAGFKFFKKNKAKQEKALQDAPKDDSPVLLEEGSSENEANGEIPAVNTNEEGFFEDEENLVYIKTLEI
ncbi:MAG: hypothetical protein Q4F80_09345, partial [bacterium]|nr:hypothetical protein [bacterium]